jgi:Flp pilus assembly protein TadG
MNTQIPCRRGRRQGGNALIEFSLSAVVLFLFSCGVADFSRLVTLGRLADGAAMAGTQYAALSPAHYNDLTGVHDAAIADTGNFTGATATVTQFCACSVGGTHVTCPASCGNASPETYVQVIVTIPFQSMFNYPWLPNPINVSSLSVVRVQ